MLGQRLKLLRESSGYTQEEVADAIGVTTNQIYRWESGKNDPSGEMVAQLARLLNATSDYLLGLADEPSAYVSENDLSPMERRLIAAMRNGHIVEALQTFTELSQQDDKPVVTSS